MDFYDRFIKLCIEKGVKPSPAVESLGIQKTAVSNWKSRRSQPTAYNMQKLADYFGVTVEYLSGKEELPTTDNGSEELNFKGIGYGSEEIVESKENIEVLAAILELSEISRKLKLEQIKALINIAKNMQ